MKKNKDEIFQKLGEHLYYLTQEADGEVYNRWSKIGLTNQFADHIVTLFIKLEDGDLNDNR